MENAAPPVPRPLSLWVKLLGTVVVLEAVVTLGLIAYLVAFGDLGQWAEAAVTPVTPRTPVPLLTLRAEMGDAAAQADLGWRYLRSIGGAPRDYRLAFFWLQRAASQGNPRGETALGLMYAHGYGVVADTPTALALYRKAAQQDFPAAEANLGVAYFHGFGVAVDYPTALDWFRKAAAGNDAMAEDFLGGMYEHGQGVPADPVQALDWFRKSAAHGRPQGERNLGLAYLHGHGTPVDYTLALYWLGKAADHGDARAEFQIGRIYERGLGVPANSIVGAKWYAKARADGYAGPEVISTGGLTTPTLASPVLTLTLRKNGAPVISAVAPTNAGANDQTNAAPAAPAH